jgi:hypothetical protein
MNRWSIQRIYIEGEGLESQPTKDASIAQKQSSDPKSPHANEMAFSNTFYSKACDSCENISKKSYSYVFFMCKKISLFK